MLYSNGLVEFFRKLSDFERQKALRVRNRQVKTNVVRCFECSGRDGAGFPECI